MAAVDLAALAPPAPRLPITVLSVFQSPILLYNKSALIHKAKLSFSGFFKLFILLRESRLSESNQITEEKVFHNKSGNILKKMKRNLEFNFIAGTRTWVIPLYLEKRFASLLFAQ